MKRNFDWSYLFLPPGLTLFCVLVFLLKLVNNKFTLTPEVIVIMGMMIGVWIVLGTVGMLLYFGFSAMSVWTIIGFLALWVVGNLWY